MTATSPLAPSQISDLSNVPGFQIYTGRSGLKYQGRDDLLVVNMLDGGSVAGVFTTSKTASAPVLWSRQALARGACRGLVVNAGNANTFTGKRGEQAVADMAQRIAEPLGIAAADVMVASTGVIGEYLDMPLIHQGLDDALKQAQAASLQQAAKAIMTTDTFAKVAVQQIQLSGNSVTIGGIAKGSGMIAPDMATMLSFIFCDAAIDAKVLQDALATANHHSFNAITVDSDTSTSDTCVVMASGLAGNPVIDNLDSADGKVFAAALAAVLKDLALQVVCDGEGASKLIEVNVTGAESDLAARQIALSIANSPLVKTAIAGEDANWGRVVMAVGKSGEAADRDRLQISMGGELITAAGECCSDYDEQRLNNHLKGKHIDITVDIGLGDGAFTVWTCDLTHGYISINADYRS